MRNSLRNSLALALCLLAVPALSQEDSVGSSRPVQQRKALPSYSFVRYAQNSITGADALEYFYAALDSLESGQRQKVNILHLGDSHIQADVFSGRVRELLQQQETFGNGGRGFVFPYTAAKTNNPANYRVASSGAWESCRCVSRKKDCPWGVAGITISTRDTLATLSINPNRFPSPVNPISRVRVFYAASDSSYRPVVHPGGAELSLATEQETGLAGMAEFRLEPFVHSVRLSLERSQANQNNFVLQGITLENDEKGIQYHSMGVNGADVQAFLRCPDLRKQAAELRPDLIIVSLGTNDAFHHPFSRQRMTEEFGTLLDSLELAAPNASILLTTPGDCYRRVRRKRYVNTNIPLVGSAIMEQTSGSRVAVWDFFSVMGGLRSVIRWQLKGLATTDRVHLTNDGYRFQGDLLFDALIRSYESWKTGSVPQPQTLEQP